MAPFARMALVFALRQGLARAMLRDWVRAASLPPPAPAAPAAAEAAAAAVPPALPLPAALPALPVPIFAPLVAVPVPHSGPVLASPVLGPVLVAPVPRHPVLAVRVVPPQIPDAAPLVDRRPQRMVLRPELRVSQSLDL